MAGKFETTAYRRATGFEFSPMARSQAGQCSCLSLREILAEPPFFEGFIVHASV